MSARDAYQETVFKLGDLAYERLWNKPGAPHSVERVIRSAEALEASELDLREIEDAMNVEEAAFVEFREACEVESETCRETAEAQKKAVQAAEGRARSLDAKVGSRRKDLNAGRLGVQKLEGQIRQWDEIGEAAKAGAARENLKKAKIDLMKRQREIEEMQAERERVMDPPSGPAADAIRARKRELDLQRQLAERTEAHDRLAEELSLRAGAAEKTRDAARAAYERALVALGEEVYQLRLPDPLLAPFYPRLDKASR